MPKKSRNFLTTPTRIRYYIHRFAEQEVEDIGRFREHVREARNAREKSIEKRAEGLPEEAQEFLADDLYELDLVSGLTDQLSIVALYRVVELYISKILVRRFGVSAVRKAYRIDTLEAFLKSKGVDLKAISHFKSIDELRLLNNAVKHSGVVSAELAKHYPRWKKGNKLEHLDKAYERLHPKVSKYILRFAEAVKLKN